MKARLFFGLGPVLLAWALLAGPAVASQQCGKREAVISILSDRYGESRRGIGVAANGTVLEIFASASTGSWTAAVTLPDGQMCLLASGQGWEDIAATPVAPGTEG